MSKKDIFSIHKVTGKIRHDRAELMREIRKTHRELLKLKLERRALKKLINK